MQLLLTLLDRVIQLSKERRTNREALYREFVAPALEAFEGVHRDYIDSFKKYHAAVVDDAQTTLVRFIEMVRKDAIFSENLRVQLDALEVYGDHGQIGPFIRSVMAYLGGGDRKHFFRSNIHRSGLLLMAFDALDSRAPIWDGRRFGSLEQILEIARSDAADPDRDDSVKRDLNYLASRRQRRGQANPTPAPGAAAKSLEQEWRRSLGQHIEDIVEDMQQLYGQVLQEHNRLKKALYGEAYGRGK